MNPRYRCPICYSGEKNNFGDHALEALGGCPHEQAEAKDKKPGLMQSAFNLIKEANLEVEQQRQLEAEQVHQYRLQVDPDYRARLEGELMEKVRKQQESEREATRIQAEQLAAAEEQKKVAAEENKQSLRGYVLLVLLGLIVIGGVKLVDYLL